MNKDKINKERKEKAKNIAFKILHGVSYALSTCFIATCIVACASSGAKNKSNNSPKSLIQYRIEGESELQSESESVNYPIYDDENYSITFNYNQFNNYSFNNLYSFLSYSDNIGNTYINYENMDYEYNDSYSSFYEYKEPNENSIIFVFDYELYNLEESTNLNHNYCFVIPSFESIDENLTIGLGEETLYNSLKQAIELDIQANEPSNENPTSDIFTAISDTITNFVIALNSGITAIVGLFWNSTSSALTPLGVLTTIVVGVALAYFVFRLIIGLIRLRG